MAESASFSPLETALAAQIRAERAARRWTQDATAARCNLARMVYIRIETATRHVSVGQLERIATAFDIAVHDLVRRAQERQATTRGD